MRTRSVIGLALILLFIGIVFVAIPLFQSTDTAKVKKIKPFNSEALTMVETPSSSTTLQPMNVSSTYYETIKSSPVATFNAGVYKSNLSVGDPSIGEVSLLTTNPELCSGVATQLVGLSSTPVYLCSNLTSAGMTQYTTYPQLCFSTPNGSVGCSSTMYCSTKGSWVPIKTPKGVAAGVCIPLSPSSSQTSTPWLQDNALPAYLNQIENTCAFVKNYNSTPTSWILCNAPGTTWFSSTNNVGGIPLLQSFVGTLTRSWNDANGLEWNTPSSGAQPEFPPYTNQDICGNAQNWGYGRLSAWITTPFGDGTSYGTNFSSTNLQPGAEQWAWERSAWAYRTAQGGYDVGTSLCDGNQTPYDAFTYALINQPQIAGSVGGVPGGSHPAPPSS